MFCFQLLIIINFDHQNVEVMSDEDDDEEDDIIAMVPISESSKLVSLEKMVWLLAVLVENSRGDDNRVKISVD